MKKQILTSIAIVMASTTVFAGPLDGTWSLHERRCTTGQKPDDAFQLERDQMEIIVKGSRGHSVLTIDGKDGGSSAFSVRKHFIRDQNGDRTAFVLTPQDELILISTGFGDGGSCPEGTELISVFKRK